MNTFNFLILLLAYVSAAFAQQAPAPDDVPQITMEEVSTSGSGCPSGTVAITFSSDRTVVTLGFTQFQLAIGRGTSRSERAKTCNIHLNLYYPPGYSYAVVETTFHGYAQLDEGIMGSFETEYVFADEDGKGLLGVVGGLLGGLLGLVGDLLGVVTSVVIRGGGEFANGGTFDVSSEIPTEERVMSPCEGKNVNLLIRTTVALDSDDRNAEGILSEDDATVSLTQQVHFTWEKCED